MYFHSLVSLFVFLPFILVAFPIVDKHFRQASSWLLLAFSLAFYSFDVPWFAIPLLVSSLTDYFVAKLLVEHKDARPFIRKIAILASIAINIGLLCAFKYHYFIGENISLLLGGVVPVLEHRSVFLSSLVLPAGISFYTFQTLSFTIDSFRGRVVVMPRMIDYMLYVTYFPQLVAGPILRPSDFFDAEAGRILRSSNRSIQAGANRLFVGLFLKLCLADELARLNDIAFSSPWETLHFLDAWTMAFGFGLQIYFDFSAYSHMAIGISLLLGLKIRENFDFPYLSASATEFWRRWHISLSSWIADYLYSFLKYRLPSFFFGFLPLLVTWAIMGLWHGPSWLFVMWGLVNGFFVLIHRIYKSAVNGDRANPCVVFVDRFLAWPLTLFSLMASWILFRSTSWDQAWRLVQCMADIGSVLNPLALRENYYLFVAIFLSSSLLAGVFWTSGIKDKFKDNFLARISCSSFALAFALIFINRQASFIYFAF